MSENFLPQYAAQAIVDLEQSAKRMMNAGPALKKYALATKEVSSLIRHAVHVVLPENGEVYRANDVESGDTPPSADEVESFCLPAPVTCFQYPWTHKPHRYIGSSCAPKRITLVCDGKQTHAGDLPEGFTFTASFFSVIFEETLKRWILLDTALNLAEPLEVNRSIRPWGYKAALYNLMTGEPVRDAHRQRVVAGEYKSDINAVIQCCHSLRAGATLVEKTEPSPMRRWKFEKKGVGGLVYHVLTLPSHTQTSRGISTGTHGSPRFHVRRAHIRKLPTGCLTFVRQCFVGDRNNGVLEKSYRMVGTEQTQKALRGLFL